MAAEEPESPLTFYALGFSAFLGFFYSLQFFYGFNPGYMAYESPWWKFFTSIFGHSGLEHLLNNLFFIGLFGTVYERYTSGTMFFTTFLVSALTANLTAFIFFTESFIIGASGGAMGILAALAVYKPRQIGLALGVPLPMWAVLIVYILIDTVGLAGTNSIANEAHLFGMFTGAMIGYSLRSKDKDEENEEKDKDKTETEEEMWEEKIRRWEEKYMMN